MFDRMMTYHRYGDEGDNDYDDNYDNNDDDHNNDDHNDDYDDDSTHFPSQESRRKPGHSLLERQALNDKPKCRLY